MGEEFLELECKLLKDTLDRMMKINKSYQLRSMFCHAVDRLTLIYRIRYKKLVIKDVDIETIELINNCLDNDQVVYCDTDSIKVEKGGLNNERSDS